MKESNISRSCVSADLIHETSVPTKIRGLSKKILVSCSITADQWELYDGADREDVASKLSLAFETAVNKGLSYRDVSREVEKTMVLYRDHGASDSESIRMLERMLAEVFS
jgi:hypothetical protein